MNKELMDYYIKRSDERFDKIESKIDKLGNFKWKIIGFSICTVFLFSLIGMLLGVSRI